MDIKIEEFEIQNEDNTLTIYQKEINLKEKVSKTYFKFKKNLRTEFKKKYFDRFIKDLEIYYKS